MNTPEWKLYRHLPLHLKKNAVELAIRQFILDARLDEKSDYQGLVNRTLLSIVKACVLTHDGSGGDFWAAIGDDGNIYAYALASIVIDVDNSPTYWVTQGWIHPNYRHKYLKEGWNKLEKHARSNLCHHIINVTNRHSGAYLRLLGKEWHPYATLLKKDLN